MQDLLEEYMDQVIDEVYIMEIEFKSKEEIIQSEQKMLIDKFMPIINKKEYKYYCIYNFCNPLKSAAVGGALGAVAGNAGAGAAASYVNAGHYTLYGSNEKPFSLNMLSVGKSMIGNPWKSEMKAKQLKASLTTYLKKKSQIPSQLSKYVIER
jgi:hypothetical protein